MFSTAGDREKAWGKEKVFREGQKEQRLDDLFLFFLQTAKRLQPKVVIAENVKGLITGNAKGWVNLIVKAFDDAGYRVQIFLFNSARMGVPQKRERVFFIAHRKDLKVPKLVMWFDEKPIPFKDVREPYGKPPAEDSLSARILKYRLPTDRDVSDINIRVRKRHSNFTSGAAASAACTPRRNPRRRFLRWNHGLAAEAAISEFGRLVSTSLPNFNSAINHDDEPVQTITAGGHAFRMCDGLLMTDRDIINCQTFPQDYDFMDQSVQYVCGMSVPPVMMAQIARQVYEQWLK